MRFMRTRNGESDSELRRDRMRAGEGDGRKAAIRLWIVQGLLAAVFLFAGGMKLALPMEALAQQSHLPGLFMKFIGVCETGLPRPDSPRTGENRQETNPACGCRTGGHHGRRDDAYPNGRKWGGSSNPVDRRASFRIRCLWPVSAAAAPRIEPSSRATTRKLS
jgi:hypothetical protein